MRRQQAVNHTKSLVVKRTLSSGDGRSHTAFPLGEPPPAPTPTPTSGRNPPGPARLGAPAAEADNVLAFAKGVGPGTAGVRETSRDGVAGPDGPGPRGRDPAWGKPCAV